MARTSIAAQAAIIAAQAATINELEGQVKKLQEQLATAVLTAPARPARPAYVPPAPTEAQLAYRAAMAAARELAMRTGKSVRVG